METAKLSLRGVVDGASAEELRGVLLALEGRVVDLGEHENIRHGRRYNYCCTSSVWYTDSLCYTCRLRVYCKTSLPETYFLLK